LTVQHNKNLLPLRVLKDDYGVQPTIVAEVETELMWTKRFQARFVPVLTKAIGNGLIEVLDVKVISRHVGAAVAPSVYAGFQSMGLEYNNFADRGESYTLAAAVTLGAPAMSNDKSALDALDFNGKGLPSPVLRTFDILAFAYQIGALQEKDCDKSRQELVQLQEHVPAMFKRASFIDGLSNFCPRITDGAAQYVGVAPRSGPAYASQITVIKK
jgi:hypothetical protein